MARVPKVAVAVAGFLGWDAEELEEQRYQPTRTPCPVYYFDDGKAFTATRSKRAPATHWNPQRPYQGWSCDRWEYAGQDVHTGWHVWEAIST